MHRSAVLAINVWHRPAAAVDKEETSDYNDNTNRDLVIPPNW